MSLNDIYPRKDDKTTIYLKNVITKQDIIVGDYTIRIVLVKIFTCKKSSTRVHF